MDKLLFRSKIFDIDKDFINTIRRIDNPINLLKICKNEECFCINCPYFHDKSPDFLFEVDRCSSEFLSRVLCYHYVVNGKCPNGDKCRRIHFGGFCDDDRKSAQLKLKLRNKQAEFEIYCRKIRQLKKSMTNS